MKRMKFAAALMALMLMTSANAADLGYDPQADAFVQYEQAVEQARASGKLVLIVAGGDWCRWCHVLERFVKQDEEVQRRLNETFVLTKVYVGPDNYNELFFSQLPKAYGAPHFWIVSPEREVLASQSTAKLEHGKSTYDKDRFLAFIDTWQGAGRERHARASSSRTPL